MATIAPATIVAHAVGREGDVAARTISEVARAIGSSEIFRVGAVLRPAEMGEQDHLGALVGEFDDGRRDALDAGGVGDRCRPTPAR